MHLFLDIINLLGQGKMVLTAAVFVRWYSFLRFCLHKKEAELDCLSIYICLCILETKKDQSAANIICSVCPASPYLSYFNIQIQTFH